MFNRESGNPYKPSFATVTGWGVDPNSSNVLIGLINPLLDRAVFSLYNKHVVQLDEYRCVNRVHNYLRKFDHKSLT